MYLRCIKLCMYQIQALNSHRVMSEQFMPYVHVSHIRECARVFPNVMSTGPGYHRHV